MSFSRVSTSTIPGLLVAAIHIWPGLLLESLKSTLSRLSTRRGNISLGGDLKEATGASALVKEGHASVHAEHGKASSVAFPPG